MPLKIADTGPSGITSINKWADEKERDIGKHGKTLIQHEQEIFLLHKQIADLTKKVNGQ